MPVTTYWIGGSGSQSWSNTANWSAAAVPATGDTVFIINGSSDIDSGLAQSGVTLASLTVGSGFTGTIGGAGEAGTYLAIGITLLNVVPTFSGNGFALGGITRFKWNAGSVDFTANIQTSGQSADDNRSTIQVKGGTSSSVMNVTGGSVDLAAKPGETATLASLAVGGDGTVICGSGLTCPIMDQENGTLLVGGAVTTLTQNSGTLYTSGTSTITTLYVNGTASIGNRPAASDAIGTLTINSSGTADTSVDPRILYVTNNPILNKGATLNTFSKGQFLKHSLATLPVTCSNCGIGDVTINWGTGYTVTFS